MRPKTFLRFFAVGWLAFACSSGNEPGDASSGGVGSGGSTSGGTGGGSSGGATSAGGASSTGGSATGGSSGSAGSAGAGPGEVLTLEEGDPAICGALGEVSTVHAGYAGDGFFDGIDRLGASISWVIEASVAGEYQVVIRYANGASAPSGATLRVAHADAGQLAFEPTGDWASWSSEALVVSLAAGVNHVSVVADTGAGLPNVDSLSVVGAAATGARCDEYAPGAAISFAEPSFQDASVHDPSVIDVSGTRYVFGSHLASAKTTDWMDWTLVAGDGVNASNPLFDNVVTELSEAFDWSTVVGLWAADVFQLESTGKYLMYYNSCKGDEAVSAMGIASADAIEGPYTDEGLFLRSGFYFHDQNNPDGSFNNTAVDPNAIDPDAFYDADGVPWLVYGSYSGGIFILELDPATGLPAAGQDYYGKHLLGGGHAPIEGPYIQYSPDSGYYYLFTSYGGLAAADGYNMRIARAEAPDGPYLDMAGVNQVNIKAPGDITTGGVKIMGNHQWAGTDVGYLSAGHNSTFYEAATGQYFLIFHTRFPGSGEFHQLRVHEMFVNLDGWFVAAPLRYAPRTNDSGLPQAMVEYVGLAEIGGTYQMVNHGRDMSGTLEESVEVSLGSDGTVSGAMAGTWVFGGNNAIALDLGGTTFTGVLSRQWNEAAQEFQVTVSALNAAGEALWGIRAGD